MAKLPSFQFYVGDWLKDPNLRRCSHAAKGVWIDMLCLMFECDDRGVLATAGHPWTDEEIVAAVGGDQGVTAACLHELIAKGVAGRCENGAVYSRRLVRDEEIRKAAAKRQREHRHGKSNGDVTPMSQDSSSSSSDSSSPSIPRRGKRERRNQESSVKKWQTHGAKHDRKRVEPDGDAADGPVPNDGRQAES